MRAQTSIALVLFALCNPLSAKGPLDSDSEKAKRLVQAALEAEIGGTAEYRRELVNQAIELASTEPSAHWHRGEVLSGRDWKPFTEVVSLSKKSKILEEYRTLRDASEPTLSSQIELAQYCRRNGLKDQALAHWSAILELDPNHTEARKQLGFLPTGDRWLLSSELENERKKASKIADLFRRNSSELKEIAEDLKTGKLTSLQALERISQNSDAELIPLWELFLSSAHEQGASVVVAALGSDLSPEATLSLARHATWANSPSVRTDAIEHLKTRDQYAFIPSMLSELRGPWLASREWRFDGVSRFVNRYTMVADAQDKQVLRILDDTYFLRGIPRAATTSANVASNLSNAANEETRRILNGRVEQNNARIMQTLAAITQVEDKKTPQDWWEWWDESNEVYSAIEKPILASYAYRNTEVIGAPLLSESGSRTNRPSSSIRNSGSNSQRKECLAGGTPIVTQRGQVAIERIRIGDLVLAQHPVTGEVRFQPVLRTTTREPEQLIQITLQSGSKGAPRTIRASGGHPFWISGKGWVRARMLETGMRLHGLENFSTIEKVDLEDKSTKTYNLVINEFHSYFVGPEAILSHDNSLIEPVRCKVPGLDESK